MLALRKERKKDRKNSLSCDKWLPWSYEGSSSYTCSFLFSRFFSRSPSTSVSARSSTKGGRIKPLSVTSNSVSSRTAATWATTAAPTLPTAAVREPTLLFATERRPNYCHYCPSLLKQPQIEEASKRPQWGTSRGVNRAFQIANRSLGFLSPAVLKIYISMHCE